jgi:hypothetical protein
MAVMFNRMYSGTLHVQYLMVFIVGIVSPNFILSKGFSGSRTTVLFIFPVW